MDTLRVRTGSHNTFSVLFTHKEANSWEHPTTWGSLKTVDERSLLFDNRIFFLTSLITEWGTVSGPISVFK